MLQQQIETNETQANTDNQIKQNTETEKILCPHCERTATNGIKCKGICVAENDY